MLTLVVLLVAADIVVHAAIYHKHTKYELIFAQYYHRKLRLFAAIAESVARAKYHAETEHPGHALRELDRTSRLIVQAIEHSLVVAKED